MHCWYRAADALMRISPKVGEFRGENAAGRRDRDVAPALTRNEAAH
jgi:hypothetical protein